MRLLIAMLIILAVMKGLVFYQHGNTDAAGACGVIIVLAIIIYLKTLVIEDLKGKRE